jgi:hypothetical protein
MEHVILISILSVVMLSVSFLIVFMVNVVMISIAFNHCYAECHYGYS